MAKAKAKTIEDALALFKTGKSPRECEKLTGINYKAVEREAKKRGIKKGELSHLVSSMARDKADFVALSVSEQDIVSKQVEERTKHTQILNNLTLKNMQVMSKKLNSDFEIIEHKLFQETVNKASEQLLGKEAGTVINNTNAQQTIVEPVPVHFTRAPD